MTRKQPRVWTDDRLDLLHQLIDAGYTDITIARKLKTTPNAIKIARQRHLQRFRLQDETLRTARQVAALFGVGCSKTIARWIASGWLVAKAGPQCGPNTKYWVHEDSLLTFIQNPATWPAWAPEKITDPGLREWAKEQRGDVVFLTPGQVGERFGVTPAAVNTWIARGLLPATRYGNWWVRESDLTGFVPPYEASRAGIRYKRFRPAEDADLQRRREAGETLTAIAAAQGRSVSSVFGRLERLAERAA